MRDLLGRIEHVRTLLNAGASTPAERIEALRFLDEREVRYALDLPAGVQDGDYGHGGRADHEPPPGFTARIGETRERAMAAVLMEILWRLDSLRGALENNADKDGEDRLMTLLDTREIRDCLTTRVDISS